MKKKDLVSVWIYPFNFHSRGSDWHARHRQPGGIRSGIKKSQNLPRGNVSFQQVAANDRSMARAQLRGHAELGLFPVHLGKHLHIRLKTRRLDVIDPAPAAAAILVPVNNHTCDIC